MHSIMRHIKEKRNMYLLTWDICCRIFTLNIETTYVSIHQHSWIPTHMIDCTWWTFLLATFAQWKFLVLFTSPTLISQKVLLTILLPFSWAAWNLFDFNYKKWIASYAFWIFNPYGFICSFQNSLLSKVHVPSTSPLSRCICTL